MFETKGRPKRSKPLGRVQSSQMSYKDGSGSILKRLSPVCEKCNSNKYFNIYKRRKSEFTPTPIFPILAEIIYEMVCSECGETIELDFEEFEILRPIIKINNSLEKGKISEMECEYKVEEILKKLKR